MGTAIKHKGLSAMSPQHTQLM